MKSAANWKLLLWLMLQLTVTGAFTQQDNTRKDTAGAGTDSVPAQRVVSTVRNGTPSAEATDTVVSYQLRRLREFSTDVSGMASWLKRGVDTVGISLKIAQLDSNLSVARRGILSGQNQLPNLRNLKSSLVLIENIKADLDKLQTRMDKQAHECFEWQQKVEKLRDDSLMRKLPKDTSLEMAYRERITEVLQKVLPAGKGLRSTALQLGIYQNQISELQMEAGDDIEAIKNLLAGFYKRFFQKEVPYLLEPHTAETPFNELVGLSTQKAWFTLRVYVGQTLGKLVWLMFCCLLFYLSALWAIRSLYSQHKEQSFFMAKRYVRFPFAASLFIALGFGQYFYDQAPAIFIQILWIIALALGTFIFYREFAHSSFRMWMLVLPLFALACISNLSLQTSNPDRWLMLLLNLAGILLAIIWYRSGQKPGAGTMPLLHWLMVLFALQQAVSLVANIAGRYTMAKIMVTGGYFNFIIGIMLWWMMLLLTEYSYLLLEALRKKESFSPYFNFTRIKDATRPVLEKVMIVLWVIIFMRNLNLYDMLVEQMSAALSEPRAIGDFTFSFGSILIFFFILAVATLVARVISFMLGQDRLAPAQGGKSKMGGTILIIRLVILSAGFLLAVAAAGIPLDKITIIIGALGVGIGFGLQNIVNNLVSGVIIAFERPINVGDQIEVGGRLGRVMDIGIRSSKLATFDGAEVIIPNGDLLNQHLVNWTLTSNNRRVEILVGVKYGSDLKRVKGILEAILDKREGVMHMPAPLVLIHQFGSSSIDFRVLFWTNDITEWMNLKSQVIEAIDVAFKENDIEIPFPQQDIYIREMPGMQKPANGNTDFMGH